MERMSRAWPSYDHIQSRNFASMPSLKTAHDNAVDEDAKEFLLNVMEERGLTRQDGTHQANL